MDDGRDRALLRHAVNERWPIDPHHRAYYLGKLLTALHAAVKPREIASIVRTAALLDNINVKWAEMLDRINRLDRGDPTEHVVLTLEFDTPNEPDDPTGDEQAL